MATLQEQLVATEAEFEQAKAHCHRCEGALAMLKHILADTQQSNVVEGELISPPQEG